MREAGKVPNFKGVMVYLEHSAGQFESVSLEILGRARQLADAMVTDVTACILGRDVGNLAKEAVKFGADHVIVADAPELKLYTTEAFCNVLAAMVSDKRPEILLMGATHDGRDLAGRLAVRLQTGLTAHAVQVDIEPETGLLVCGVPGFGGSIVAKCKCPRSRPQIATVRPGIFPPPARQPERRGEIESVHVDVGRVRTRVIERSVTAGVDLAKAEIVVIAGRGAVSHFNSIRDFAASIGSPIGVTRPLADRELMPRDYQVGSTGTAIAPKLAIVLGASGAAHFVSGIRGAETVISVNRDPEADIGANADYVVIEDIGRLVPALISKTRRKVSKA